MKSTSTLEINFFGKAEEQNSSNAVGKFELTLLENNCYTLTEFSSYQKLHVLLSDCTKISKILKLDQVASKSYKEFLSERKKVEDSKIDKSMFNLQLFDDSTADCFTFRSSSSTLDFSLSESLKTPRTLQAPTPRTLQNLVKEALQPEENPAKFVKSNLGENSFFEGYVVDKKANGFGYHSMENGDRYIGMFKDNNKCGKGYILYADGGSYFGDVQDDTAEGSGESKYANGNIYRGEYKDGIYHGYGILEETNGTVYRGSWCNGEQMN